MDSNLTFLAEASVDLKRVNTTLYKIISQELNFLDQLTSFREMLQSAKVLTNTSTKIKRYAFFGVTVERPDLNLGILSIAKRSIPHHFSSRLDFMNSDFRSVSLFRKTDQTDPTIGQDIVNFFEKASPIHYSLVVLGLCFAILVIVLLLCVCYLKVPQ